MHSIPTVETVDIGKRSRQAFTPPSPPRASNSPIRGLLFQKGASLRQQPVVKRKDIGELYFTKIQRYWGAVFDKKRVCLERHSFTPSHLIPNGFYFPPFLLSHQKNSSSSISNQHKKKLLSPNEIAWFQIKPREMSVNMSLGEPQFNANCGYFWWGKFHRVTDT